MKTHSVLPFDVEYHLGLMEKQIKRVAELGGFLPFAGQQEELIRLVTKLKHKAACLRSRLLFSAGSSDGETMESDFRRL